MEPWCWPSVRRTTPAWRLRAGEAKRGAAYRYRTGVVELPGHRTLEIAETRDAVRTEVFGESGYPQMLLRVGWAPVNADPAYRRSSPVRSPRSRRGWTALHWSSCSGAEGDDEYHPRLAAQ